MPVSATAQKDIQATLDSATADPAKGLAGVVFVSVDKNGEHLAAAASGNRGLNTPVPMDLDTVFWIASCTKLITGIACMQLVEAGKLSLDDPQQVESLAPEVKRENKKVLSTEKGPDGKPKLEERKGDITLRSLLTHTAGFGYTFFHEGLRDAGRPVGWDEFTGDARDILEMPLAHQPGTQFEYGTNIDWAGILVERATGQTLNDYFVENIFEPLGIEDISMFPSDEMKSRLATMHQRWTADSPLEERDHLYRRPLRAVTDHEKKHIFNSGGAGCYAKPTEYAKILATLLNDGVSPHTNNRILQQSTVEEMFTNQIPQFPDFGRQVIPAAKPDQTNRLPDVYPQAGNPPQGWGLTFMITIEPGPTGRGKNTAFWAGLANLFWWIDREKGVAGMIASQVLPFGDPTVLGQWVGCEKAVYDALQ